MNITEKWQLEGYEAACARATRTGIRKAMALAKRTILRLAPRSARHRVVRLYPSGYRSGPGDPDAYRLSAARSIKTRVGYVRGSATRFYGYLRNRPGYSVFVNYGIRTVHGRRAGVHYMERGLEAAKPMMIPLLRKNWPK